LAAAALASVTKVTDLAAAQQNKGFTLIKMLRDVATMRASSRNRCYGRARGAQ
jgi:hypothetical protein